MVASTPAEGYAACCDAIRTMDLRPRLAAIEAPTLVLAGAEDAAMPSEHGRGLAAALPSARFELLPDAAHLPNLEHPPEFTRLLLDHLAPH
jgi:3-oxoadipate enol-lactonase